MAQIVLTLEDAVLAQVLQQAEAENISSTAWLDKLIKSKLNLNANKAVNNTWSSDVVKMAGSWTDFPNIEEIRQSQVADVPREQL